MDIFSGAMHVSQRETLKGVTYSDASFTDLLIRQAESKGESLAYAYIANGETLQDSYTFAQLDRKARSIAAHLQARGLQGSRALLLYPSGLDYVAAFFGCLYAGVTAVPVFPPQMGRQILRIDSIIRDANAKAFLSVRSILAGLTENIPDWTQANIDKWVLTDEMEEASSGWQRPDLHPDTLAFLQYTSGSTGLPKGVMVSHGNLMHNERVIAAGCGNGDHTTTASWLPLYHDMGLIGVVLHAVYLGRPAYMMSPISFLQKPLRWLQMISTYGATYSGAPNFAYELCASRATPEEVAKLDLSRWDMAFNGAEPVRAHTLRKFTEVFAPAGFRAEAMHSSYGMAEATLLISNGNPGRNPVVLAVDKAALKADIIHPGDDNDPETQLIVGCGHPWEGQELRIVHPDTREALPDLKVGEIWLKGPSVCQGYWDRPQETQDTFRAEIAPAGEGPFLRTGDLGFVHEGETYITGRLKDLIIIRGRNLYPQDIELAIELSHPSLKPGGNAAFSVDVNGEERLVVIQEVEAGPLKKVDPEELFMAIRKAISLGFEVQVYEIVLVKRRSILKTSSGKIMRSACKLNYLNHALYIEAAWTSNS